MQEAIEQNLVSISWNLVVFYFVLHLLLPPARAPHAAAVSIHRSVVSAISGDVAHVKVRRRQRECRRYIEL